MASRATDHFNGKSGDHLVWRPADTGQPWKLIQGSVPQFNGSGLVRVPKSNPVPICVLNTGAGGGDVSATIGFPASTVDGVCLYFRVLNAGHWWRFAKRAEEYTYQYISGYTEEQYGYVGNGTYYYTPEGDWVKSGTFPLGTSHPEYNSTRTEYWDWDSRINTYRGRRDYVNHNVVEYEYRQVHENTTYQKISGGDPIYSTATSVRHFVALDKCANGITYNMGAQYLSGDGAITSLKVEADGPIINCYTSASVEPVLSQVKDSFLSTVSWHGIGNDTAAISLGSHLDYFDALPNVVSDYMPRLML